MEYIMSTKVSLSQQADKFATSTGADVGVTLFSLRGKPCFNDSTNDRHVIILMSNQMSLRHFEDLDKELQALNKKEQNEYYYLRLCTQPKNYLKINTWRAEVDNEVSDGEA
ncbi:hypothetical protein H5410_030321 [Solanum commersonii]|uniref:Uncharacterized protein n=1 Tax=Solanum commersonii TaxID=4109 RepID=A0A9J5YGI6_SOLCO|nr:hypothetical protein H5410_030321 [Solanum commersonii]